MRITPRPFALSLSKGCFPFAAGGLRGEEEGQCFEKLSTNGKGSE
jgi:hypothetical protein